jgi:alpha/beta superfamily hydrolase
MGIDEHQTRIAIPLETEGHVLEGVLHEPRTAEPRTAVLLCHPHPAFGGSMDTPLVLALAEELAARGRAVLRFNFRGVGASTGRPTGGRLEHLDVLGALVALEGAVGREPPHVVGYSFGAAMALIAVAAGGRAASLCLVGFPTVVAEAYPERIAALRELLATGPSVTFIRGENDPFCKVPWMRENLSADLRIVELAGEGHFFEGERAPALAARVAGLLEAPSLGPLM